MTQLLPKTSYSTAKWPVQTTITKVDTRKEGTMAPPASSSLRMHPIYGFFLRKVCNNTIQHYIFDLIMCRSQRLINNLLVLGMSAASYYHNDVSMNLKHVHKYYVIQIISWFKDGLKALIWEDEWKELRSNIFPGLPQSKVCVCRRILLPILRNLI